MFCSTFVIITTRQAPKSSHWKAVSSLPLSGGIWVGAADMLSEVSAPHGDTHHYHHRLPPPPSQSVCLSVCLALSWAVCFPRLMERQSHCWLTTLGEGGNSSKNQGSILPIRKLRNTQRSTWKQKTESLKRDKHNRDNFFCPFYFSEEEKKHKQTDLGFKKWSIVLWERQKIIERNNRPRFYCRCSVSLSGTPSSWWIRAPFCQSCALVE